jgi:fimbrial isopeptide formation D2 family protein/uncharacterized repeat protein (TIGR01451 family)
MLMLLTLVFDLLSPAVANAGTTSVSPDDLFDASGMLVIDTNSARLKSATATAPNAGDVLQRYDDYAHIGSVGDDSRKVDEAVLFRIPVPADRELSYAEGQHLLDGLSFDIVWDEVGSYRGKPIQIHLTARDYRNALTTQTCTNIGWKRMMAQRKNLDQQGEGYWFSFTPLTAGRLDRTQADGECYMQGCESARFDVVMEYEDGTPVMLEGEDSLYCSIPSLDAAYLTVEGVQINSDYANVYLSSSSTVERGDITKQSGFRSNTVTNTGSPTGTWTPSLAKEEGYIDSEKTPTFHGTAPDAGFPRDLLVTYDGLSRKPYTAQLAATRGGYASWNDTAVCYSTKPGGKAETSFTLISQGGGMGFPLSFAPLTSNAPEAPVKSVDDSTPHVGDTITFDVAQTIGKWGADTLAGYHYSSWTFADSLPVGLIPTSAVMRDGAGTDVTSSGEVRIDGQEVTFAFSDEYLSSLVLDGSTFHLLVSAKVDEDAIGTLTNVASTTFNTGKASLSNEVGVTPIPMTQADPEKTVSVERVTAGDEVTWDISQKIMKRGVDCGERHAYSSWAMTDDLPEGLSLSSLKVIAGDGSDVTARGELSDEDGVVTFVFDPEFVADIELDGSTWHFLITTKIADTARGIVENPKATCTIDGGTNTSGPASVTVVERPAPAGIDVVKSASPASGTSVSAGDTIDYELRTSNVGAETQVRTLVRDFIPDGTAYVEGSISSGGVFVPADAKGNASGRAYVEWIHEGMADGEDRTTSFSVRVTGDGKTVDNVALHGPVEGDAKPGDPALVAPATETNRVSHEVLAGTKPEGQAGGGKPSGAYPHTGAGSDSVILTGLGILATGMGCVIALRLRKSRRGGNQTPPKVY